MGPFNNAFLFVLQDYHSPQHGRKANHADPVEEEEEPRAPVLMREYVYIVTHMALYSSGQWTVDNPQTLEMSKLLFH